MVGKKSEAQQESGFPKTSAPATRALHNAGYTRLEQLTKVSEAELAKLHGMGPKALGILKDALKAKGLKFK
jgi:DNA-directed RNA polymerase alpha subunit